MEEAGLLQWSPRLETGIKVVDDQHQILVEMCNQTNRKLADGIDRGYVEQLVVDLMSYALYHFDQEEELMQANQYRELEPAAAARHVQEHRSFSDTVSAVQQKLQKGELISRENLMGFLNGWLVGHILNTDMELAQFLRSRHGI